MLSLRGMTTMVNRRWIKYFGRSVLDEDHFLIPRFSLIKVLTFNSRLIFNYLSVYLLIIVKNPAEKLKDALSSQSSFEKTYLEMAEMAISTYKHIGRIRSARFIGIQNQRCIFHRNINSQHVNCLTTHFWKIYHFLVGRLGVEASKVELLFLVELNKNIYFHNLKICYLLCVTVISPW